MKLDTVSGSALDGLLSCWDWLLKDSRSLSDSASLWADSARCKEEGEIRVLEAGGGEKKDLLTAELGVINLDCF